MKKLEDYVISIPDFPEPGIIFRDVTSILQDAEGLKLSIDGLCDLVKDIDYDLVVGAESRGFILVFLLLMLSTRPLFPQGKRENCQERPCLWTMT